VQRQNVQREEQTFQIFEAYLWGIILGYEGAELRG